MAAETESEEDRLSEMPRCHGAGDAKGTVPAQLDPWCPVISAHPAWMLSSYRN